MLAPSGTAWRTMPQMMRLARQVGHLIKAEAPATLAGPPTPAGKRRSARWWAGFSTARRGTALRHSGHRSRVLHDVGELVNVERFVEDATDAEAARLLEDLGRAVGRHQNHRALGHQS